MQLNRLAVVLAVASLSAVVSAGIVPGEGLHMPGAWNGWANYPSQSYLNTTVRAFGPTGNQWTTTINVQASGGDITGGTYGMLFTSGPSGGGEWNNKWANATLGIDGKTALTWQGGSDNSITVANGNYYTFVWVDNGYANTDVAVMKTSAAPISISSVSNGSPNVSITLSGAKSAEERVLVRYTTDAWATSNVVEATGSGTSYSATIPGATQASYYVATTTITSNSTWLADPDIFTLAYSNNGGSNYLTPVSTSQFSVE